MRVKLRVPLRDFIVLALKKRLYSLRARAAKGIKLGKPKGIIQASMYDNDKEKILHLYQSLCAMEGRRPRRVVRDSPRFY